MGTEWKLIILKIKKLRLTNISLGFSFSANSKRLPLIYQQDNPQIHVSYLTMQWFNDKIFLLFNDQLARRIAI